MINQVIFSLSLYERLNKDIYSTKKDIIKIILVIAA